MTVDAPTPAVVSPDDPLRRFRRVDVQTADGLTVAAFDSGPVMTGPDAPDGGDEGPTFFLVNGLGGNLATWCHLIGRFAPRHRIATWDYRGLFASRFDAATQARHQRGDVALGMQAHRDDALRVLDRLGIERAVFFGWSMGVLVNWDLYRAIPERVLGMVQICGAASKVLHTTALGQVGQRIALPSMDLWRRISGVAAPWVARAMGSSRAIEIAAALGAVAPSIDINVARAIAAEYVKLDFDVYNRILAGLAQADASDLLPRVARPVLVVAGDRDVFTPAPLSEAMARSIPGAELLVMKGGSHYLPIEFPALLNETVASFVARRVAPGGSGTGGVAAHGRVSTS
ncbi:MAG: alpha/beta hydrolase [Deltaproteobacteria bacterium]|nr:alpha/beta hydrolase [Deltaproteobacteria bacterium]